jgi:hypothetical protein
MCSVPEEKVKSESVITNEFRVSVEMREISDKLKVKIRELCEYVNGSKQFMI